MDISRLIAENGACFYLIAFIWTYLEGETFVLFAAFAAAQGLLNPALLFLATWLGSFSGDQTYFWIGRCFGLRLLNRFPKWRYGVESALYWLERYNTGFILTFRFIYGIRNFSSFAMGLSAVHWKRFLALNCLAAGLWAGSFVALGLHGFGAGFERFAHGSYPLDQLDFLLPLGLELGQIRFRCDKLFLD